MTQQSSRRRFLRSALGAAAGAALSSSAADLRAQRPGERPPPAEGVKLLNPRARVPVSLIIDDSTCLVNLNHFATPQFIAVSQAGGRHSRVDWRSMPREIPDDFVRKFGEWCGEHGVKGKYSIVPYPACVGRLDGELPGWPRREVDESIRLVRELMMPNWDIHPEMVTHTRVIDIRTGHPYRERGLCFMENWEWSVGRSADELAEYMRYALTILRNIGLPCEGITTPGGFGYEVLPELAQATLESCRDVFGAEIPHYFRHTSTAGDTSVAPRVEYVSGLDGDDPRSVVSIIACTGDWTGGWDCSNRGYLDRFISADLEHGRMVDVIGREEPAVMLCHWTGIYFNGEEVGFTIFQEVVRRLHARFDNLIWMKLSEIARYWAAKELTATALVGRKVELRAPFACPGFTLRVARAKQAPPRVSSGGDEKPLREVPTRLRLEAGTWARDGDGVAACFDLRKGRSTLLLG